MITEQVALQLIKDGHAHRVVGWRNFLGLRALVKCQPSRLLNSQWADWHSHGSTPPDIQVESSYEGCISASFCVKDSRLALDVSMADGDVLDGQWKRHRCSWLILPDIDDVWIQNWLHDILKARAEQEILEEERLKKEALIEQRMRTITRRFENQ